MNTTTTMTPFEFADDELSAFFMGAATTTDDTLDYSMHIDLKPIQHSAPVRHTARSAKSTAKRSGASNKRPGAFHSASSKSDMIPLPTGVVPARCGYRTGKCQNLQAVKRNGKLHKLCEFHREKANQNQKKLDRKKRLQRTSPYDTLSSEDDTMSEKSSPRAIDDVFEHEDDVSPAPTSLHEAPLVLGCEEIAIFYSIMTFDLQQLAAIGRPVSNAATGGYASPYSQQAYMSIV